MTARVCRLVAAVAGAVLSMDAAVDAHLVTTGLGPVYDGISHVFLSPDDLVPVIAMALLAGLNGPAAGRHALFVLPVAWLIGGVAGFLANVPLPGAVTVVSFLALGGLVASDRVLPGWVLTGLAVGIGLLHGWLNGAALAAEALPPLALVGIVSTVFVLVAFAASLVVVLRVPWQRIAVRVVGSWVAAIGLLLLGWSLRGGVRP